MTFRILHIPDWVAVERERREAEVRAAWAELPPWAWKMVSFEAYREKYLAALPPITYATSLNVGGVA